MEYEIWEHTADVGIAAYGSNLEELFRNAAKGMFDIITGKAGKKEKTEFLGGAAQKYNVNLSAISLEQLVVDWLSELLYLFSAFGFLGVKYDICIQQKFGCPIKSAGEWLLMGIAEGIVYEREKHGYGTEIKAVTYHMLEVKKNEEWMARVLFDV